MGSSVPHQLPSCCRKNRAHGASLQLLVPKQTEAETPRSC